MYRSSDANSRCSVTTLLYMHAIGRWSVKMQQEREAIGQIRHLAKGGLNLERSTMSLVAFGRGWE